MTQQPTGLPTMLELKKAMQKAQAVQANTVMIYGAPKVGKTGLAGTVATMPSIERVFFFDVENGGSTLLNPELGLTDGDLAKVQLIPIIDTKDTMTAIDTLLKYFSAKTDVVKICALHSKVDCPKCNKKARSGGIKARAGGLSSRLSARHEAEPEIVEQAQQDEPTELPPVQYHVPAVHMLTPHDAIIIDTMSQVGVSAGWAGAILNQREEIGTGKKNAYGKYMKQGEMLTDLLSMIQATRDVTIICTAHSYTVDEDDSSKPTLTLPAVGTKNFSRNVAKFFSNVVVMAIKSKKFKAGSTPTYELNTVAGSRLGSKVESITDRAPCMADILTIKGG